MGGQYVDTMTPGEDMRLFSGMMMIIMIGNQLSSGSGRGRLINNNSRKSCWVRKDEPIENMLKAETSNNNK